MSESKRRKVPLACGECRERKRKCDGERPRCGNCAKRKPPPACIYTDENLKRGSSSYVESLRTRIKELEENLEQSRQPVTPESPVVFESGQASSIKREPGSQPPTKGSLTGPTDEQRAGMLAKDHSTSFEHHGTNSPAQEDESAYSGIGVMGTPGGELCPHCRGLRVEGNEYSGSFTSENFDFQIRQWTERTANEQGISEQKSRTIPKMCRCWAGRILNISHAITGWTIPPRVEADALVNSYFERVYSLYPFLIRQIFMQNYMQLWYPPSGSQVPPSSEADTDGFYGLLNSVFALGAQYADHLEPIRRASISAVFYNRAIESFKIGLLDHGNIELVQALLLSSQYLQSTPSWEMCWNLAGLAVRVAQGIGLHVNPSESSRLNRPPSFTVEEAMRRRAWAGCVTLDRVLALLYGKPQMLHPSLTRSFVENLPDRSDEELATGIVNRNEPRKLDFFVESLHLIHYLGQILDLHNARDNGGASNSLQGQSSSGKQAAIEPTHLQRMLNLDATLVAWKKRLPHHLQTNSNETGPLFVRQAQVLRVRYLHMRVFLLRPVLLAVHQHSVVPERSAEFESAEHLVELSTLTRCAKTCLEVTIAVVDVVYNDVYGSIAPSIVWWYGLYYIYFCATVIHAGRLCAHLPELDNAVALQQSFHKCLLCLQKYEAYGISATKCRMALETLEKRAFPVQPPPLLTESSSWTPESTYMQTQATNYGPSFQYSVPTNSSAIYDGFGGAGFFSSDADNFFWTTFIPPGNNSSF